jgi:hypothetical protein
LHVDYSRLFREKVKGFFRLACRRLSEKNMPRLHKMSPGFQRGDQNVASPLRTERDPEVNFWFFHSNKLNHLLRIESDVLFFCVVILELRPDVVAYDSIAEDSPEAVRAKGADLIVRFANGKTEYWWCRREPEKGHKRRTEKDFRFIHGGDVELGRIRFDNSLLLSGAITAACDYDCNPTCHAVLQMFDGNSSLTLGEILSTAGVDAGLLHAVLAQLLAEGTLTTDLDSRVLSEQSVVCKVAGPDPVRVDELPGSLGSRSGSVFAFRPVQGQVSHEDATNQWTDRPRRLIPPEYQWAMWPTPDASEIPDRHRALYAKRKQFVDAYRRGAKISEIEAQFEISDGEVRRQVKRCVTPRPGGGIYGYYALIRGKQIERGKAHEVERPKKGRRNAWTELLEYVEGLLDSIKGWVLEGDPTSEGAPLDITGLHTKFVEELYKAGVGEADYPLCNADRGQDALYRYVRELEKAHLLRYTRVHRGEAAEQRATYLGRGYRRIMRPLRPGSFVQLDYWRTDKLSKITFDNGYGDSFEEVLPKFYYAVLIDELFSYVLSGYPTLEKTASTESALETLDRFVRPDRYRQSDFARDTSIDILGPCFSPELVAETQGSRFNVLRVDNAWANLSDAFIRAVVYGFGAAVNFGPTYTWVTRAVVERVIGNISRLVRKTLEAEPVPSLEQLRYALDEACLLHNTSKTKRLNFSAPIDALLTVIKRRDSGLVVMPLPQQTIDHSRILDHYFLAPLKRNDKTDVRPTFERFGHRYENELLGAQSDLLRSRGDSSTVAATVKRYDVRDVTASVVGGQFLGQMISTTKPDQLMSRSDAILLDRKGRQSRVRQKQQQAATGAARKGKPNTAALEQARQHQRQALHGIPPGDATATPPRSSSESPMMNLPPVTTAPAVQPVYPNSVTTLEQEPVLEPWGRSSAAAPASSGRVLHQEAVLRPWSPRAVHHRLHSQRKTGRRP